MQLGFMGLGYYLKLISKNDPQPQPTSLPAELLPRCDSPARHFFALCETQAWGWGKKSFGSEDLKPKDHPMNIEVVIYLFPLLKVSLLINEFLIQCETCLVCHALALRLGWCLLAAWQVEESLDGEDAKLSVGEPQGC